MFQQKSLSNSIFTFQIGMENLVSLRYFTNPLSYKRSHVNYIFTL